MKSKELAEEHPCPAFVIACQEQSSMAWEDESLIAFLGRVSAPGVCHQASSKKEKGYARI